LFAAFEKHQYYNIKDLEKITRQPIVSLNLIAIFEFDNNYTLFSIALPKRNSQRNMSLQCEESAQEHVGIKARI